MAGSDYSVSVSELGWPWARGFPALSLHLVAQLVRVGPCSYTVGGNVNWYSHYGEQYAGSLKNKIELPYDTIIPLLGIYLEKNKIQKETRTPVFTEALFIIAKTWKKCPSTEVWIKKMWYIYTMEYYSAN